MKKLKRATLTCPKCGYEQDVDIPTDRCLPFYKCGGCEEMIWASGDSCCVVCDYSDAKCPVSIKK